MILIYKLFDGQVTDYQGKVLLVLYQMPLLLIPKLLMD